jgi:hypothetical protein
MSIRPPVYLDAEIAAWNEKLGPVSFGIEPDGMSGWYVHGMRDAAEEFFPFSKNDGTGEQ